METRTLHTGTSAEENFLYSIFILKIISELVIPSPDGIAIVPDVLNDIARLQQQHLGDPIQPSQPPLNLVKKPDLYGNTWNIPSDESFSPFKNSTRL